MSNSNKKLSKEMIDNITNYSDQVRSLKDFVQACRKRPGMHIGSIGNPGFINMIREILQNALDELNKPTSPCDQVWISFDEKTQMVIVEDNGRGIPFGRILDIFEKEYTSSNYDKKPGEYSSGLHGVGAKVTNALSSKFIVESYILGDARTVEFTEGYPWDKGEVKIPNKDNKQGTRVTFVPSIEAIGETSVTWSEVYNLVNLILPQAKLGAIIHFSAISADGKVYKETLVNKDGIMTYMIDNVKAPLIKPIHLFKDTGFMRMNILFTYEADPNNKGCMFAFANTCPTTLGTHIKGFMEGVSNFFVNYMNKTYLNKDTSTSKKKKPAKGKEKAKLVVTSDDVKQGLACVISVDHLDPIFDGQSKEKLSNEDMKPFVKNNTMDLLDAWSKENASDFLKVCRYLKDMAELRTNQDKEKVKITAKYSKSILSGLPDKFVNCIGKKDEGLEFWIAEGDSAAGTMKNNRNNRTQAYFPIRGKLPNAFSWTREKFLNNAEISGIIAIIFDGYKDFDINKLGRGFKVDVSKIKWSKIIIGTDADSDGNHINALILRFFILYIPELLMAGMVYRAVPPLYGIEIGKKNTQKINLGVGETASSTKKMIYFTDRMDYVKYIQKDFAKRYVVADLKTKKQLSPAVLSKILYVNMDYTYELNRIANRYSIDPVLLESILTLRSTPVAEFKKKLKKAYRFLNFTDGGNGLIIIEGVVNSKYQTVFFNQKLIDDCQYIIEILNKNESLAYIVNESVKSLYEMMTLFENSTPKGIERYKGLGEMDGAKLYNSTLDPTNRTLIRFTLEDAKAEVDQIRYYENNIAELISTVKVSRFDVMD